MKKKEMQNLLKQIQYLLSGSKICTARSKKCAYPDVMCDECNLIYNHKNNTIRRKIKEALKGYKND